jgi:hypothetical protein
MCRKQLNYFLKLHCFGRPESRWQRGRGSAGGTLPYPPRSPLVPIPAIPANLRGGKTAPIPDNDGYPISMDTPWGLQSSYTASSWITVVLESLSRTRGRGGAAARATGTRREGEMELRRRWLVAVARLGISSKRGRVGYRTRRGRDGDAASSWSPGRCRSLHVLEEEAWALGRAGHKCDLGKMESGGWSEEEEWWRGKGS